MVFTLFYVLLAALGLGLLIFIHEYGHYWMAKREGMVVEIFSIGFGKPLYVWKRGDVRWQLCMLPFGGYVRISGMEKKGHLEPYEIPDGFYGKTPMSRIRVALAGPVVNIVFAFAVFATLWMMGGREKPFSEYTHLIGSVEKDSGIYAAGVRAGDEIVSINHRPFLQFQDFVYTAVLDRSAPLIEGKRIDYLKGESTDFEYQVEYPKKASVPEKIQSVFNMIRPASYLIFDAKASFSSTQDSPMQHSGIENGDRVLWADGKLMFSRDDLIETINEPRALLTVKRGQEIFLARVPRMHIADLRIGALQRAELEDWQHEAQLVGRGSELFFIPYNLTNRGVIEEEVTYLNDKSVEETPSSALLAHDGQVLQKGDQILAVDGIAASSGYEVMRLLQTRHIQVLVKKAEPLAAALWTDADQVFFQGISWEDLNALIRHVGIPSGVKEIGNLKLLSPVEPRSMQQMPLSKMKREAIQLQEREQQKLLDAIKDPKQREMAQNYFDQERNQLKLGIVMRDAQVVYNPTPLAQFTQVLKETWKTLVALFTGSLSPKYLSGPVGIVQVMQKSWGYGFKEAFYWLGMISLNLGLLNLFPVPVLDGGHICFSLWEKITGKKISSKIMERLIIPFVVLLITLFIYLTYNDLLRVFKGLF